MICTRSSPPWPSDSPNHLAVTVGYPAMIGTGHLGAIQVRQIWSSPAWNPVAAGVFGAKLLGSQVQAVPHLGGWAVGERRDRERKDGVPSPEPGGCGCRLYDRRVWKATEVLMGPCNRQKGHSALCFAPAAKLNQWGCPIPTRSDWAARRTRRGWRAGSLPYFRT